MLRIRGLIQEVVGSLLLVVLVMSSPELRAEVSSTDTGAATSTAGNLTAEIRESNSASLILLAHRSPRPHTHPREESADTAVTYPKEDSGSWKSPSSALALSLWGTVVPTLSIYGSPLGLVAGPALGYFYGGKTGRALLGMGIRLVGMGGVVAGFAIGLNASSGSSEGDVAGLIFFPSAGILLVSAVYDIARVKHHVRERNARLSPGAVSVSPRFYGESNAPGLELVFRF